MEARLGTKDMRNKVEQFEVILKTALEGKYASYPHEIRETIFTHGPVARWGLLRFIDAYVGSKTFPEDRLEGVIYRLFDVKLELYYLLEVDIGLYNRLVHERGYDDKDPAKSPAHVLLTRLSLDQSLIGKSRVLWERIMNLIYYLETGEDLDRKVSGRRSKKKVFFDFANSAPRWLWLAPYGKALEEYDNEYRTPEYHKSSVLRAELLGSIAVDPNELLKPINLAVNNIWENLLSIVGGGKARSFSGLHLDESGRLAEKYLE